MSSDDFHTSFVPDDHQNHWNIDSPRTLDLSWVQVMELVRAGFSHPEFK